ncbi:MAG: helix-turn-helix domain-containing protein [Bacteroidia bacterium]|jgi:transcriptional regulator GlxA family with amidase domain|nr:helix-turn-helix domain-containing protein [Bacteroidia bacterium]
MKTVSILVPESSVMQAIAGSKYLFSIANRFLAESGKPPLFHVQLAGATREVKLDDGAFTITADVLIEEVEKTDLVIIPPLFGQMEEAVALNQKLAPWINEQYQKGAEVASLCLGAFLLASTGLLEGKKCSTHWGYIGQFRQMYPEVEVVDGSIITEENRLYSSGGANSYWNLLLHILEKHTHREIAVTAAKFFAIDIDRNSQSAFVIFQGQKSHKDAEVLKAQEYIEQNLSAKTGVDELAGRVAVGRRSFERRFKTATGNTVLEYIQRVKIESAKRYLENSRSTVNEVMMEVGYSDTKAFRTIFRKITGLTPVEYRNKYYKASS